MPPGPIACLNMSSGTCCASWKCPISPRRIQWNGFQLIKNKSPSLDCSLSDTLSQRSYKDCMLAHRSFIVAMNDYAQCWTLFDRMEQLFIRLDGCTSISVWEGIALLERLTRAKGIRDLTTESPKVIFQKFSIGGKLLHIT